MLLSVDPNPNVTFGVRYADDDLLVVEKPPRVPTQPGKGHAADTLLNGLFAKYGAALQNLGKSRDFGLLHRLDKDTSGLLIVALKPAAYDALRLAFEQREIRKFYWAVCGATPRERQGVVRMSIAESPGAEGMIKTAHISRSGKAALTAYRVIDSSAHGCLIEARPVTGRLHQVRVHMDAIGCPILGDTLYGPRRIEGASARVALHAHRIAFKHPVTGREVDVRTGWPNDLRRLLRDMGLKRPDFTESASLGEPGAVTESA